MINIDSKPTDIEIVGACINVFCTPLARAIVAEMKAQGLVVPQAEVSLHLDTTFFDEGMKKAMEQLLRLERTVPTIVQIPSVGTCGTCMWCPKVTCNREGSPRYNHRVLLTDNCDLYKVAETPKRATLSQPTKRQGPYPKAKCNTCGGVFTVSKNGKLYPHDVHGQSYRLRMGDRGQPCFGKPMKEVTNA